MPLAQWLVPLCCDHVASVILRDMPRARDKSLTYRPHSAPYVPPIEQLRPAIGILRRRLGRGLGRIPNKAERAAMQRCAEWEVIATYARTDPTADATVTTRLDNIARRACRDMEALLERNEPKFGPDRLRQYAEMIGGRS